jgi:hypothetical protein
LRRAALVLSQDNRKQKTKVLKQPGDDSLSGKMKGAGLFLVKKQKSKQFEKGFDLFNRGKRIELPASLVRNNNQKLLLGLAAIANKFSPAFKVDSSVVRSHTGRGQ